MTLHVRVRPVRGRIQSYPREPIGPTLGAFAHERRGVIRSVDRSTGRHDFWYFSGLASTAAHGGRQALPVAVELPNIRMVGGISLPASDGRWPTWSGKQPNPATIAAEGADIVQDVSNDRSKLLLTTSGGALVGLIAANMLRRRGADIAGVIAFGMPTPARRKKLLPDSVSSTVQRGLFAVSHSNMPEEVQALADDILSLKAAACEVMPESDVRRFLFTAITFLANGDRGEDRDLRELPLEFRRIVIDYFYRRREHVFPLARMLNQLNSTQSLVELREAGVPVVLMRGTEDTICTRDMMRECVSACVDAGVDPPDVLELKGMGHMAFGSSLESMQRLRWRLFSAFAALPDTAPERRDDQWASSLRRSFLDDPGLEFVTVGIAGEGGTQRSFLDLATVTQRVGSNMRNVAAVLPSFGRTLTPTPMEFN